MNGPSVVSGRRLRCAVVALAVIAILGASPHPAAAPPVTAKDLLSQFRQAINANDKSAVDALVYWGTADSWSRQMTESVLGLMERGSIASTRLAPLDASSKMTMKMPNGKKYGPSIPPVYRVIAEYVRGKGVTKDESEFTIGKKDGAWYIIAIAVIK